MPATAALLKACRVGNKAEVAQLLEEGAVDPNACSGSGYYHGTALMAACAHGRLAVVQLLLADPRVDLNAGNAYGLRPVHKAVESCVPALRLLLAKGDDPRAHDITGTTPLMEAKSAEAVQQPQPQQEEVVRLRQELRAAQVAAAVERRRREGLEGEVAPLRQQAAAAAAERRRSVELEGEVARLRQRLRDQAEATADAAGAGAAAAVRAVLVALGAAAPSNDAPGSGGGVLPVFKGHALNPFAHGAVDALFAAAGPAALADADARGWTALHHAAAEGKGAVAEALLRAGADVGAQCRENKTPAQVAASRGHAVLATRLAGPKAAAGPERAAAGRAAATERAAAIERAIAERAAAERAAAERAAPERAAAEHAAAAAAEQEHRQSRTEGEGIVEAPVLASDDAARGTEEEPRSPHHAEVLVQIRADVSAKSGFGDSPAQGAVPGAGGELQARPAAQEAAHPQPAALPAPLLQPHPPRGCGLWRVFGRQWL
ncbi:MAG: ankyrin repeat-containing domain protein [Monoraphidium minutum]|nr:MAG: ankyrin repeat-containing domain protein [Monoraphidium minutum]